MRISRMRRNVRLARLLNATAAGIPIFLLWKMIHKQTVCIQISVCDAHFLAYMWQQTCYIRKLCITYNLFIYLSLFYYIYMSRFISLVFLVTALNEMSNIVQQRIHKSEIYKYNGIDLKTEKLVASSSKKISGPQYNGRVLRVFCHISIFLYDCICRFSVCVSLLNSRIDTIFKKKT